MKNIKIKAIETRYAGYHFRSRVEARWAVYFDDIGIKYEYEKEGYELGELGWYLPDFWLPEYQMFAEVKGGMFTTEEIYKCTCLVANIPDSGCLFLTGPPEVSAYFGFINLGPFHIITVDQQTGKPYETDKLNDDAKDTCIYVSQNRQLYSCSKPVVLLHFILKNTPLGETQKIRTFPLCHVKDELNVSSLIRAVNKSKSARFEFNDRK